MNENTNNYNQDTNNEYTWQNPNPYNSNMENKNAEYTGYTGYSSKKPKPPKKPKRKLSGVEWALISVGGVAVVLLITVISLFATLGAVKSKPVVENEVEQLPEKNENKEQNNNVTIPSLETQPPSTDAMTIPQVYSKVKDSVVGIIITKAGNATVSQGSGTGIILSEDGYISTNAHVVDGATTIKVVLANEKEYTAELIGSDSRTDIAVIKIDEKGLQPAEFGDSDSLVVGETVIAIGNPYGLELAGTVTSGIVSALNRQIVIEGFYMTLIQTDASINPGNSGGPLVNSYGQVIGITSSKIVQSGYEGIGFAIPMSGATKIIEELIQHGYIKNRPFIGITGSDIDKNYAQIYSIPEGVYVEYVDPESDAHKKGLKHGDIIVAVDGVKITSMAELDAEKNKKSPGDTLKLTVYRNTKKIEIEVLLSESTEEY